MRVKFYDLGPNPIVTLFLMAITFLIIWLISNWIADKDIPVVSIFFEFVAYISGMGFISMLFSIPLNFILLII